MRQGGALASFQGTRDAINCKLYPLAKPYGPERIINCHNRKLINPMPSSCNDRPLVVDLDGTLARTDVLVESFLHLLAANPVKAVRAASALLRGKAALKSRLARESLLEIDSLPFSEEVRNFLLAEKAKGRPLYLASAADQVYVEKVAAHFGFFDGAFGSKDGVNLAGRTKAERLCHAFGEGKFDYIGDARVDEPVWRKAAGVYVANARPRHLTRITQWAPHAVALGSRRPRARDYLEALRPHQWLKNILIYVPALAAHQLGASLFASAIAFLSFSLCASSVYILNDLLDLKNDRAHARKQLRPFAAGRLPLAAGAFMIPCLLLGSISLALFLPLRFIAVLAGYYALTCAYSFHLKRRMLVDVFALACLYGARVMAGAAACGINLTPWLIAFAVFLFLSLALVKRCSELHDRQSMGAGNPVGRGYVVEDLPLLQVMSIASGYMSVLVMALYVNGENVRMLYSHPTRLWVLCVLLLYWVSRVSLVTHRGEMHDDPIIFAVTDRVSRLLAIGSGVVVLASI
jgi:4-hydroxybenzoate polyprenyltransferase